MKINIKPQHFINLTQEKRRYYGVSLRAAIFFYLF